MRAVVPLLLLLVLLSLSFSLPLSLLPVPRPSLQVGFMMSEAEIWQLVTRFDLAMDGYVRIK